MEPGKTYVCTNAFAGSVLASNWRVMIKDEMWALSPLLEAKPYPEWFPSELPAMAGNKILLMRGGGFGDLLMMTPMIQELQKHGAIVHVAMGDKYHGIFKGLGVVEELMPIEAGNSYDFIASFEGWIEGHPGAEKVHIAQQFADKFGIKLEPDVRPFYRVTEEEHQWALKKYTPNPDRKRIGIQWMASALCRSYRKIGKVAEILSEAGCEVMMFGAPGQFTVPEDSPLVNLTQPGLTFRESAAVALTCDCIIAPDSALVHLASALDVPCVGLYGAFPANLRGSGPRMKGIQGMAPCSPCFYHAVRATDFPAGMPCKEANFCVAIDEIKPEQVAETAMNLASPIIRMNKGFEPLVLP